MKIDIRQIPPEGLSLKEEIPAGELDSETEIVKFASPLQVAARVQRITNAVNVEVAVAGFILFICSRCLASFKRELKKSFRLNYQADNNAPIIELNPEIREEVMLDYPIKPLCRSDCRGLCAKCGKNLNEGGCSCATA